MKRLVTTNAQPTVSGEIPKGGLSSLKYFFKFLDFIYPTKKSFDLAVSNITFNVEFRQH